MKQVFAIETNQARRRRLEAAFGRSRSLGVPVLFSHTERIGPVSLTELFALAEGGYGGSRFFWSEPDGVRAFLACGAAWELECGGGADRYARLERSWRELNAHAVIGGEEDAADNRGEDDAAAVFGGEGNAAEVASDADGGRARGESPDWAGPILVGGFSFDPEKSGGELWRDFPDSRFVLPTWVVSVRNGEARLTYSRIIDPADRLESVWEECGEERRRMGRLIGAATASAAWEAAAVRERDSASREPRARETGGESGEADVTLAEIAREEWLRAVEQGVQAIRSGQFEKVVLARMCLVEQDRPFDLRRVLETLRHSQPGTFVFAVESGESCFVGATPERLVRRENGEFITLSLAGTAPRGETPEEDERIGRFLLTDGKNRHEHALAVRMIAHAMGRLCTEIELPGEPILYRLKDVQHLQTPIRGRAKEDATLLQAVGLLHPTPALGGMPREAAMEFIRRFEPTNRGWYAAPIGWIDRRGEGEFVAGIRSALVRGGRAVLFAGCGIVGDSAPESEYAETVIKFRPMIAALTGGRKVRMSDRRESKTAAAKLDPADQADQAEQVEAK